MTMQSIPRDFALRKYAALGTLVGLSLLIVPGLAIFGAGMVGAVFNRGSFGNLHFFDWWLWSSVSILFSYVWLFVGGKLMGRAYVRMKRESSLQTTPFYVWISDGIAYGFLTIVALLLLDIFVSFLYGAATVLILAGDFFYPLLATVFQTWMDEG